MITLRSTARLPYVATFDPAVDTAASDLEKYKETLDEKHLKFVDGGIPSRFHLKRLTGPQRQHVRGKQRVAVSQGDKGLVSIDGTHESWAEAIAYGLERVENFEMPVTLRTRKSDLGDRLHAECMDVFLQCDPLLKELGEAVIRMSDLGPLDGKP